MTAWTVTVPLPVKPYLPRVLPAESVRNVTATITYFPIPYVIVIAPSEGFFADITSTNENEWEHARRWLAGAVGIRPSALVPKLGVVAAGPAGPLFRTRKGASQGWHEGAAGGGLLAFGGAALHDGTVPSLATGETSALTWTVSTPAGRRTVAYRLTPEGRPGLAIAVSTSKPVPL